MQDAAARPRAVRAESLSESASPALLARQASADAPEGRRRGRQDINKVFISLILFSSFLRVYSEEASFGTEPSQTGSVRNLAASWLGRCQFAPTFFHSTALISFSPPHLRGGEKEIWT